MSFHIGQQVICVNDQFSTDPSWRERVRTFPRLNAIYTIRDIVEGVGRQRGLIGFCFYEIVNPVATSRLHENERWEPAFNSKNFRPVKPTSIEIFKELLVPLDRREPVS